MIEQMESGNPWNNPLSRFTVDGADYRGNLYFNGIEYRFSLRHQTNGKYVMRGQISAISPVTGRILTVDEQAVNKAVSAEVYCNSIDEAGAKAAIVKSANKLFQKYALVFARELQITARPDTIIPSVAAILYAESYVTTVHRGLKESTAEKYIADIKKFYCALPSTPMAKIKEKTIRDGLKDQRVGKDAARRLRDFCQFLIDRGHIAGDNNPFPPSEKREASASTKQKNVEKVDELTLDQQDKLYDLIMHKKNIYGGDCGVAMYVWGGFKVDDKKTWGDLIIIDADDSFVVVKHQRNDLAGATHKYDRPLFPQAANILIRARNQLLEKYSENQIRDMPIISMTSDPTRSMQANNLHQYAGKLLREIGISEATFSMQTHKNTAVSKRILLNTYEKNVNLRIGLKWDEGALRYLQGLSLSKNVTNDNYTSFSDDDAMDRLHTAMMAIQPERELNIEDQIIKDDAAGKIGVSIPPRRTRERVGVITNIILQPGGKITVECRHGVNGVVEARELSPDGKKRRASRKTKS